jgi:hypothetical protein
MKIKGAKRLKTAVDQLLLQDMFTTSNQSFDPQTRRFSLRLHPRVGVHRPIFVGFFSGIDIPHAAHVVSLLPNIINKSLNWKPYMLHLAWQGGPQNKAEFMAGVGIDFMTHNLQCKKNPEGPNWTKFFCSRFAVGFLRMRWRFA